MAAQTMTLPSVGSPETETVEAAAVRERFDTLIDRVAQEGSRVVVERAGRRVAALVSMRDLARLQADDERLAERRKLIEEFAEPFKDVPPDEIQREVDRAVAAVRARRRAAAKERADVGAGSAE